MINFIFNVDLPV